MRKRLVAILVTGILGASLLAGCGKNAETNSGTAALADPQPKRMEMAAVRSTI